MSVVGASCSKAAIFTKHALFGGLSATYNTTTAMISALVSVNRLRNKSPGDFYPNLFTLPFEAMGLLLLTNRLTLYPIQLITSYKLDCDLNAMEIGGYLGSLSSLTTIFFQRSLLDMFIAGVFTSFFMGALISGSLSLRKVHKL